MFNSGACSYLDKIQIQLLAKLFADCISVSFSFSFPAAFTLDMNSQCA